MKDLNPEPIIKNPDTVTAKRLTRVTVAHGIHTDIKVVDDFGGQLKRTASGKMKWLTGWDTTHDITTNLDRATKMAVAAKMPFMLESPTPGIRKGTGSKWTCSIPPAKGRVYRQFQAKSPAPAICAAIIDWLENPRELA